MLQASPGNSWSAGRLHPFIGSILNSFYLRNAALLFILLTANVSNRIFMTQEVNVPGIINIACTFTILYIIFVFHNRVLYEQLLRHRRYVAYLLGLLTALVVYNELVLPPFRRWFGIEWEPELWSGKLSLLYNRLILVYLGLGVYLAFTYLRQREQQLDLENLNRELELKQLKAQLNPHFLFNALNNIYSYTLENSARSSELVLKLSELMRYVTEQGAEDAVAIGSEINFIEDYIAFEQERLGHRCNVTLSVTVNDRNITIAPFLLFIFVENAFKHSTDTAGTSEINIKISAGNSDITLHISNTITACRGTSTHIGLANTRRRLQLLYPRRHTLQTGSIDNRFHTRLVLQHTPTLT